MKRTYKNKLVVTSILFLFLIILSACAGSAAPSAEEPAAPEEPAEEPVAPEEPSEELPVAYGQDSRTELFQHPDVGLKGMAESVAVLVHSQQVQLSGNSVSLSGYTLNEMSEMGWLVSGVKAPMCPNELFTSQTAPGFCTGFLVEEDILVTAGHCLEKVSCADTSVVFGFQMETAESLAKLTRENVFRCKEVIAQVLPSQDNQFMDYAIIKLDRPTGHSGLAYAEENTLVAQTDIAVLGHPSGLPMKVASDAFVISNQDSNPFFVTNLDTFGSNSGSPVINISSYQVEGILVRGEIDYVFSNEGSCVQVNRCPESGGENCVGENATKMAMVADKIPASAHTFSDGLTCLSSLLPMLLLGLWVRLKAA